jgi:hypothetical protein
VSGSEQVETEADGTVITTKTENYFREQNGVLLMVGSLRTVHYDEPYSIDVSDSALPPLPSADTIPVLTQDELAELEKTQEVFRPAMAVRGDPSDPDYTESWLTVFESIETNCLSRVEFRIPEVSEMKKPCFLAISFFLLPPYPSHKPRRSY